MGVNRQTSQTRKLREVQGTLGASRISRQKIWNLQTDAPTSTRPGLRLQCQAAASFGWDLTHVDLKTAFLQGDSYGAQRDVVCQLPPEAGMPGYIGARLKKSAYGLNDAPRLWWNKLDRKLRGYGLVPTRADRCCYVLYRERNNSSRGRVWPGSAQLRRRQALQPAPANAKEASDLVSLIDDGYDFKMLSLGSNTMLVSSSYFEDPHEARDEALKRILDPVTGSNATGEEVIGIITIHVDDCFMCGDKTFKAIVNMIRTDFQVGSEDLNDVVFVGQRIRWIDKNEVWGYIKVDQTVKIEELAEISLEGGKADTLSLSKDLHTQYRSLLGQINWLE